MRANSVKVSRNGWYSRPELNRDQRFRKPLLYPFELREHASARLDGPMLTVSIDRFKSSEGLAYLS